MTKDAIKIIDKRELRIIIIFIFFSINYIIFQKKNAFIITSPLSQCQLLLYKIRNEITFIILLYRDV